MRFFRYKKQDPPKDPFAQQIYDDIMLKRKVRGTAGDSDGQGLLVPS
jgi:hypothetical protein